MAKALHCSVITPERQVFDADATSVVIPAHDGLVGILDGRAPLLCELGTGVLRVDAAGSGARQFFVDGGFAQVLNNEVIVLSERAAAAEDISRAEAAKALEAAEGMPARDEAATAARNRAIAGAKTRLKLAQK